MTTQKTYRRFSRAGEVPETKGPAMIAYAVKDGRGEGAKGFWTRIGAAWQSKSGEGLNLALELVPPAKDGVIRIVLVPPKADDQDDGK